MKKIDIGLGNFVDKTITSSIPIIIGLICMSLVIVPFRIEVVEELYVEGIVEYDISEFGLIGVVQMKLGSVDGVYFSLAPDNIIGIGWHHIRFHSELEFPADNVSMITFKTWNNISRVVSIHLVCYRESV